MTKTNEGFCGNDESPPQTLLIPTSSDCMKDDEKFVLNKQGGQGCSEKENLLEFKRSVLSFQDINYVVKGKRKSFFAARKPSFCILDRVSGVFPPGVNAIMGPSGGGKTSLLTVLAGRKKVVGAEGIILMNGNTLTKSFITDSGFVTQDDVLMPTLTVRENIMFSASLRLSTKISAGKKSQLVQAIIEELNLTKCADSKVGNEDIRGVSGGEKKRCSVGVELVTRPTILFLDEPTTGLDASTAHSVVLLLKNLAAKGCNVIMSIHQPRYDIFKLFDTLVLLSSGQVVYHGQASLTLNYFSSIGLECEKRNNPADYFLDVIQRNSKTLPTSEHEDTKEEVMKLDLKALYRQSPMYKEVVKELEEINSRRVKRHRGGRGYISRKLQGIDQATFATSFFHQLKIVVKRSFLNIIRDSQLIYSQLTFSLIYSLIVGFTYFRVDSSASFGIQNRSGALYFIIMDQVMGNLSAIDVFIGERAIYVHEATNGFYRVSVYFFSKLLGDLIPMRYMPMALVALIAYWMVGFRSEATHYLLFILALIFLTNAANSIVLFCSVVYKTADVAVNVCLLYFIMLMALGGFFVNINSIPPVLRWIKYLSIFRYGNNVLLINEIRGGKYCDVHSTNQTLVASIQPYCTYGDDYLQIQGIDYKTNWDLWNNMIILLGMTLLFWTLSYIQLLRIKKNAKG